MRVDLVSQNSELFLALLGECLCLSPSEAAPFKPHEQRGECGGHFKYLDFLFRSHSHSVKNRTQ